MNRTVEVVGRRIDKATVKTVTDIDVPIEGEFLETGMTFELPADDAVRLCEAIGCCELTSKEKLKITKGPKKPKGKKRGRKPNKKAVAVPEPPVAPEGVGIDLD